jgi:hypothetical protein
VIAAARVQFPCEVKTVFDAQVLFYRYFVPKFKFEFQKGYLFESQQALLQDQMWLWLHLKRKKCHEERVTI